MSRPSLNSGPLAVRQSQSMLLRAVDLGLLSVITVAPLLMGGRHPAGELAYICLVSFSAFALTLSNCLSDKGGWVWTRTEFFLLACVGLLVLQLMPISSSVLGHLSPSISEMLPLWSAEGQSPHQLGQWSTLSLTPVATQSALAVLLAHATLFLVVCQRLRSIEDAESLLRAVAIAVIVMAAVGLAQFLLGNGKFLWLYEHPFRDTLGSVKGPFTNANHFAHFLALGIGPLLWWLHNHMNDLGNRRLGGGESVRSSTRRINHGSRYVPVCISIGLGVVLFAGLLSFSRGGVLVMLLATVLGGGLLALKFSVDKRVMRTVGGIIGVVALGLLIYGYQPLARELASLGAWSTDGIDHNLTRQKLWAADFNAFCDYPLLGTGAGSHREVYPAYFPHYSEHEYTHAESGYVQVMMEFGLAGVLLMAIAIGACGFWCLRTVMSMDCPRHVACGCAVISAFAVSVVHAIWDFVWYIPACFSLTVILAACACRLWQLVAQRHAQRSSTCRETAECATHISLPFRSRLCAAMCVATLSGIIILDRIGPARASIHWDRYLILDDQIQAAEPGGALALQSNDALLQHVQRVVQLHSRHPRANLYLASLYLQRFNIEQESSLNPMPLGQIRDAVHASRFQSATARDKWLQVAVGDNVKFLKIARWYAKRAAALCPLQGDAYVYLAQLDFLGDDPTVASAYVQQAMHVRPYRGSVQIAQGNEYARAGNQAQTIESWKKAFHQDPKCRTQLIELLGRELPASFFLTEFEPSLDETRQLYLFYREIGYDVDAKEIGQRFAAQLSERAQSKSGQFAADLWLGAHNMFQFIGDDTEALRCIERSVQEAPHNVQTRRTLAIELLACEQHEQASEHLRWCLRRNPSDPVLLKLMTRVRRQVVTQARPERDAQMQSDNLTR